MQPSEELKLKAKFWLESDPDCDTRTLVEQALVDGSGLEAIFENPLRFGTAGLRGRRGPGPGCMNFLTILRASWAIAQLLKARGLNEAAVLIGFDARYQAHEFARAAARLLRAQGLKVLLAPAPTPTPLIAFGARYYEASCALVFTASHNPKDDSGLKVYDNHGAQIIGPWDQEIEKLSQLAPTSLRDVQLASLSREASSVPEFARLESEYLSYLENLADGYSESITQRFRSAKFLGYTPLFGVGGRLTASHFSSTVQSGKQTCELVPVVEQFEPNPDFPGMPFPNPEVEETLSGLKVLLHEKQISAGLAQDPDADRFIFVCNPRCLTAPFQSQSTKGYFSLSGDDMGLLLAHLSLKRQPKHLRAKSFVVSSIVSSPAIEAVAQLHGARAQRTLTGFKWIARPALAEPGFAFAYEEALGYLFAPQKDESLLKPGELLLADKDGIAAAAVVGRIVADGGAEALLTEFLSLQQQVGVWQSIQLSVPMRPSIDATVLLQSVEKEKFLTRFKLDNFINYERDVDSRSPLLGKQQLLSFEVGAAGLTENVTALLRPSGTEPKLKIYVHLLKPEKPESWQEWQKWREHLKTLGLEIARALKNRVQSLDN